MGSHDEFSLCSRSHLTFSSSHHCRGLLSGRFRSFGEHSKTARVHLLFISLATCPDNRNFCFPTPRSHPYLCSQITSLIQRYSLKTTATTHTHTHIYIYIVREIATEMWVCLYYVSFIGNFPLNLLIFLSKHVRPFVQICINFVFWNTI